MREMREMPEMREMREMRTHMAGMDDAAAPMRAAGVH